MNIIELCKLARQAGIGMFWRVGPLARFAKMVAEREREACAQACDRYSQGSGDAAMREGAAHCAIVIRGRSGIG